MKKMLQRGFTLIELLVVIAIIGILAAVVLASLNDARQSGSDASIKQSLGNLRSQAEIVYNRNSSFSYAAVCDDPKVQQLVDAANDASQSAVPAKFNGVATTDGNSAGTEALCNSTGNAWAIRARLASNNNAYWCVDSNGFVASTSNAIVNAVDVACAP